MWRDGLGFVRCCGERVDGDGDSDGIQDSGHSGGGGGVPKKLHTLTTMLMHPRTNERTTPTTLAASALNSLGVFEKPQSADSPEMRGPIPMFW